MCLKVLVFKDRFVLYGNIGKNAINAHHHTAHRNNEVERAFRGLLYLADVVILSGGYIGAAENAKVGKLNH